ncbi:AMP-binding protein [Prochlorococcus marinus]|uniref:AMP-binding protein n=1 Tax=Prochlorococcus marinus TaxID=1219 RepID=UPI0007B38A3D|nr:AMP-binding protein [Prochlorococcus marinus]KZR78115.1 D-alanine--poly(phosphoribitol) ligase subunit 1 [Prochlorococcus marinus str. MIT 1320]
MSGWLIDQYLRTFDENEGVIKDSNTELTKTDIDKLNRKIAANKSYLDDRIVGIYIERSARYLAYCLILLDQNITYVPLNTEWEDEYINYIIEEAKIDCIIQTNSKPISKAISGTEINHKLINNEKITYYAKRQKSAGIGAAYIIFTSGSTGKPKGVEISKESFMSYVANTINDNYEESGKYHLITGEINFDIILGDLCIGLNKKRKLRITNNNKNLLEIAGIIIDDQIISGYFIPSCLREILSILKTRSKQKVMSKKIFYCGGEVLSSSLCESIWQEFNNAEVYNMYGPTECTINCIGGEITKDMIKEDEIITGKGYRNLEFYFNEPKNICKPNERGELLIKGKQIMTGYINDKNNVDNTKDYYNTGDIFRMNKDGMFVYEGRKDKEVKIMGNRCNLEALENYCIKEINVENLVFVKYKERLICFALKLKSNQKELENVILRRYPRFALPTKVIEIKKIPRNRNGKIDRSILLKDYEKNNPT